MSFGFGVGDCIAVSQLAWKLYKSCKGAPESFGNIHTELLSFHAVLKEVEETVLLRPGSDERQSRLATVVHGCKTVLDDLQQLVDKYDRQPTKTKQTWIRIRWGFEDVIDIRGRLVSNTSMLTAFISASQTTVEAKLDQFIKEFRKGHRDGSVISVQTVDSLSTADKELWRSIRKELENMGMSLAAFDANKDFIFSWLMKAMADGAFEEQADDLDEVGSGSDSGFSGSASTTRPASPDQVTSGGESLNTSLSSPPVAITRVVQVENHRLHPPRFPFLSPMHSSESLLQRRERVGKKVTQPGTNVEQETIEDQPQNLSAQTSPNASCTLKAHYPSQTFKTHLRELLSWVTSKDPGQELINVITQGDPIEALKLLRSQSSLQSLVREPVAIRDALFLAVQKGLPELLEPLLDVGCVDINDQDLLSEAVEYKRPGTGSIVTLQQLLSLGADPSLFASNCIIRAIRLHDENSLRALLDAGVDVNASIGSDGDSLPPHRAIFCDASISMVQMILDSGAEVNRTDSAWQTPLGLAITQRRHGHVDFLISHGADLEKPTLLWTGSLVTPLIGAVTVDELSIAKLLIRKGADINNTHHASSSILDILPGYLDRQAAYPRLFRLLDRAPGCAVHAALVYDLSATGTLRMLFQEGTHTNWDTALILAFLNYEHRHVRDGEVMESSQGALVAVLTKCCEERGRSESFRFLDSQVFGVMRTWMASPEYTTISDDDSYLRSVVDRVISSCY